MPYPNEHAAPQTDKAFDKMRRVNDYFYKESDSKDDALKGIDVIFGIMGEGDASKSEIASVRFDAEKWTPEKAKEWLKSHNMKTEGFEPASGGDMNPDEMMTKHTIAEGDWLIQRDIPLDAEKGGNEELWLSFSSEHPCYEPIFGKNLILSHAPGCADISRINAGAQVILNHNSEKVLGITRKGVITPDKKGRALVRFGKSEEVKRTLADINDGIIRNTSGYFRISCTQMVDEQTLMATRWEAMDISIVTEPPADPTVGIGRTIETKNILPKEENKMLENNETQAQVTPKDVAAAVSDIQRTIPQAKGMPEGELAEWFSLDNLYKGAKGESIMQGFISSKRTLQDFRDHVVKEIYNATPVQGTADIGLTGKDKKRYSLLRAIRTMADPSARFDLTFEGELSLETKRIMKLGDPKGFYIPNDILNDAIIPVKRTVSPTSGASGGYLTQETMGSLIELLRNRLICVKAGASLLSGLIGDLVLTRQTGGATAYWGHSLTASTQAFGICKLTSHPLGAATAIDKSMVTQTSIDVEALVRNDLASVVAQAIDYAALFGTGADGQPLGLINIPGVDTTTVAGGTNGAAPTYANMNALTKLVLRASSGDWQSMGFITNSDAAVKLIETQRFASTDTPVFKWLNTAEGLGEIAGWKASISNQIPRTLTKGNQSLSSAILFGVWSDLLLGQWGAMDITVDPYSLSLSHQIRLVVWNDVDTNVRYTSTFAAMMDAIC